MHGMILLRSMILLGLCVSSLQVPADSELRDPLSIHYEHGFVVAEVDGYPLQSVLLVLRERTGMRVLLRDQDIALQPVWATVRKATLEQGVRRILSGFSYVLDRHGGEYTLYILSSNSPERSEGKLPRQSHAVANDTSGGIQVPVATIEDPLSDENFAQAVRALHSTQVDLQLQSIEELSGWQDARTVETLKQAAKGQPAVRL
jgi:hypothetical protein